MNITSRTPAPSGLHALIHTDGSCPENPGPMGIGYTIKTDNQPEYARDIEIGYRLGPGTNNRAEYLALIAALRHALYLCCTSVNVRCDSLLVVNQVSGRWKCRDGRIRPLCEEARGLVQMFMDFDITHIPREANTDADRLSKNPTAAINPEAPLTHVEDDVICIPRKISRQQAAMIRWWWATNCCRNEYRLGRIFGVANSYCGRIGRGEKWATVTEADLPQRNCGPSCTGCVCCSTNGERDAVQERSSEKPVSSSACPGKDRPRRSSRVRPGKRGTQSATEEYEQQVEADYAEHTSVYPLT